MSFSTNNIPASFVTLPSGPRVRLRNTPACLRKLAPRAGQTRGAVHKRSESRDKFSTPYTSITFRLRSLCHALDPSQKPGAAPPAAQPDPPPTARTRPSRRKPGVTAGAGSINAGRGPRRMLAVRPPVHAESIQPMSFHQG